MTPPPATAARVLAAAIEPIAGQAQFSPECHANYQALGFGASPGFIGATALPDRSAYFTARGSLLGQVPGTVVAAAFGVFNPDVVVPLVTEGWQRTDATTIWAARQAGAAAQLQRILGPQPGGALELANLLAEAAAGLPLAGRALFAGHRALALAEEAVDPVLRLWRAADALREARGDAHIIAWASEGLDPVEVGLLGDLYWGLAPRSHTAGRGWSPAQLDAGEERLRSRALVAGEALTPEGFRLREHIETRTDALMAPATAHLDEHLAGIVSHLRPWGAAIINAGGYLSPAVRFTFSPPDTAR